VLEQVSLAESVCVTSGTNVFLAFSDQNLCQRQLTRGMDVQHQVNICKCKLFWNEVRINVVFVSVLNEGVGIIPRRPISIASTKVILGLSKNTQNSPTWRVFCSSAFLSLPNKIVAHEPYTTPKRPVSTMLKISRLLAQSHGLTFPGVLDKTYPIYLCLGCAFCIFKAL